MAYSFRDVQDLYIDRPLPYLIGSKLFMEQEDVGLGELSSEEGSIGSDRGSIVDSEEEKEEESCRAEVPAKPLLRPQESRWRPVLLFQTSESDEDFANHSDNDQNRHTTQMSDEEEDDDGCDLFADSEKEEEDIEDIEENTRSKRSRPTSFADELAARIKGDAVGRVDEEPTREVKPQKTLKEKKERRTPSDDEEDNLFAPPKLTDEDFSPFGSRGGLFSGGKGLFDDEDEESDLFMEAPQDRQAEASVKEELKLFGGALVMLSLPPPVVLTTSLGIPQPTHYCGLITVSTPFHGSHSLDFNRFTLAHSCSCVVPLPTGDTDVFGAVSISSLKEPQKPEQPIPRKSPYLPPPTGLFDDDDDDDDFFSAPRSKPSKTGKVQSTADIFDDEEGDLFKEKAEALPSDTVSQTDESKARAEKKVTLPSSKNLKPSTETKTQKGLFSDEEDSEHADLFSPQSVSKLKGASLLPSKLPTSVSLFDDEDEERDLPIRRLDGAQFLLVRHDLIRILSFCFFPVTLPSSSMDNLFGGTDTKKQTLSLQAERQEKAKPSEFSKKKASALLFSSDEEGYEHSRDQWNIPASQTHSASDSRSKGEPKDSGTLQGQEAKAVKKTSLFEEDDEDDLFAIAKDSERESSACEGSGVVCLAEVTAGTPALDSNRKGQKKTQRVSLLFEDDADSGSSLFGSPPTSVPPATTAGYNRDEEEKEAPLGGKPVDKKVESAKESSEFGRTDVAESEKEGLLTRSAQEAVKHSDLFSSSSPLDKGTKARTKTVLSLFDEEDDKMEDQNTIQAPQKEVGKLHTGHDPDARPKSTGVFQDEELLFSHKLQKDNDPDVDLFAGTKKTKLLEPSVGSLFGDDEDDDLFSSAKSQPLVQEKKRVVKKDHSVSSFKNQKHPESIQGSKEKGIWKPDTPQANLAINPAALLPTAAPQISEVKPVLPELAFPSSEHRRSHGLESVSVLPGSGEAGVSFDLPAQADTLPSANKGRVKMRGKRRPQTRAARRLAAQESSEAEDMSVPRGPIAQWDVGTISPNGHRPQLRAASGEDSTEEALEAATAPWEGGPVPGVDRSPFAKSLGHSRGEADLFDSRDIFSTGTGSQSMERTKPKAKIAENPANPPGGGKEKSPMFPALGEASSDDDLFQSAKPKPAKKTNPFPLLEDEDDLFTDQKVRKNESKSSSQQDVMSTTQDIFEDDIFATEAIKPSQKTREKDKILESNLFDDNIDIFADLTVKPKEKSKKKVEAKSIFDDDMDDIFSSGIQAKTTKPKSRSAQAAPEPRSEPKVSNIFDDPLNAFGGQ
ncbi:WASH complex subunit 2C [Saguinus oedipus]|uniref:WASH complex subunit 2C n=1 Tax=Saguinus oedipus TaxID=9490 RepID=A0ABQ9UMK8_SAGOE|nr:WASH complex subunit 2C [Saguinus oedipus]